MTFGYQDFTTRIIKIRKENIFNSLDGANDDIMRLGEHSIKVVQGYGNLVEDLDQVDLVVGPLSYSIDRDRLVW